MKKLNDYYKEMLKKSKKQIPGIAIGVITTLIASFIVSSCTKVLHPEYEIGDIITLGRYEQDNDLSNGPEPVQWYVIAKKNNQYLLLSKYILDSHKYNDNNDSISWERCSLREWLNNDFIANTFSSKELQKILTVNNNNDNNEVYGTEGGNPTLDRVFLLSIDEAKKYLTGEFAFGLSTQYAYANGVFTYNPGYIDENTDKALVFSFDDGVEMKIGISKECFWFLRTPGYQQDMVSRVFNSFYADTFSLVGSYINYEGIAANNDDQGIRPALWYKS